MTSICSFDWSRIDSIIGPCLRPGGSALTRSALEVCSLTPDCRIADIGCGIGGTLKLMEKEGFHHSIGVDSSFVLLERAQRDLKQTRFIGGNAQALPLRTGIFDALFCECVLSILSEKSSALGEFARVLKKGGFLILSDVFSCANDCGNHEETTEKKPNGLFGKEDVMRLLAHEGFSLALWEEHENALKEFAVRIIMAGESVPAPWYCPGTAAQKPRSRISYFLLVAKKVNERKSRSTG